MSRIALDALRAVIVIVSIVSAAVVIQASATMADPGGDENPQPVTDDGKP